MNLDRSSPFPSILHFPPAIPIPSPLPFLPLIPQYYSLEITYFKSALDAHLLDLLWNKYWVNTLSSSPLLASRDYVAGQISDLGEKCVLVPSPETILPHLVTSCACHVRLPHLHASSAYPPCLPHMCALHARLFEQLRSWSRRRGSWLTLAASADS